MKFKQEIYTVIDLDEDGNDYINSYESEDEAIRGFTDAIKGYDAGITQEELDDAIECRYFRIDGSEILLRSGALWS